MLELTRRANVEAYLGQNVEALEDILNEAAKRYAAVQKEKSGYDFGQRLTPDRLSSLAGEVIRDTKDFLKVTDAFPPYLSMFYPPREIKLGAKIGLGTFTLGTLIGSLDGFTIKDLTLAGSLGLLFGVGGVLHRFTMHLSSHYKHSDRVMIISDREETMATGTIAHEYTHHLQCSLTELKGRDPISEGHARGVEGAISRIFAQRYSAPAYLFDHTDLTARELKDAYLFIFKKKRINPKKSLANLQIPKLRGFLYKHLGHHYSIGVAAMSIAEAVHGERVYRDVLKSDFSFLRARSAGRKEVFADKE